MRLTTVLLVVLGLASPAVGMQGPLSTTEQLMGQPVQPTASVTLPDECTIQDVLWSSDSSSACVSMNVSAVNVWPLLVRYWPEIVTVSTSFILAVILLRLLEKRWRWRRVVSGEPYCTRCRYQLTGRSDASHCPECGLPLGKGRIVFGGPRRRWPVIVSVALMIVVVGAYFAARNHVPRKGAASNWFYWPSTRLYNWAMAHQYWSLSAPPAWVVRIIEFDPATGLSKRTIFNAPDRRRDGTTWNSRLFPGTTRGRLFLMTSRAAAEIDIASGGIVREYVLPPEVGEPRMGISDIALHPSQPILYAYVAYHVIGQWDLDSGGWSELVSFPDYSEFLMYSLFPMAGFDTVILRRGLTRRAPQSGFDLIDLATLETVCSVRGESGDVDYNFGVSPGELLFSSFQWGSAGPAPSTGRPIMRWAPGQTGPDEAWRIPLDRIVAIHSARSGRLYLSSYATWSTGLNAGIQTPMIATYERQTDRYLSPLAFPPRIGAMSMSISPDEHWLVAWHSEPTTGPCLFVFDLWAIHGPAPGK